MADIKFKCPSCGQDLEAPSDMAGTKIDCPACNTVLAVPGGKSKSAPAGSPPKSGPARSGQCPKCKANMQVGAVVCIQCGYHFKKHTQLETKAGTVSSGGGGGKNMIVVVVLIVLIGAALVFLVSKILKGGL